VHVIPTPDGKRLLSMTETVMGHYLSDIDLNTIGRLEFKDGLKGDFTTAHPTLISDNTMINLVSGVHALRLNLCDPHVACPRPRVCTYCVQHA
jgi:carotenoid cleavage dioxygenase-like enzyme